MLKYFWDGFEKAAGDVVSMIGRSAANRASKWKKPKLPGKEGDVISISRSGPKTKLRHSGGEARGAAKRGKVRVARRKSTPPKKGKRRPHPYKPGWEQVNRDGRWLTVAKKKR